MATFKEFSQDDIKTSKSFLNQLVDIINTDISSSTTRRKFQVFVTGGIGPGVTSSIFQTVYDQDFTLQTANPIFDMTIGTHVDSDVVQDLNPTIDTNGKFLFPQTSLMMREKMDVYRLFAQDLLGDANSTFTAKVGNETSEIKEAMFVAFKRLFSRDQIKRETFAIRLHPFVNDDIGTGTNIDLPATATTRILTDINSSVNKEFSFGGQVSTIVDSANTSLPLGLLYLDKGVLVLDLSRSFDQTIDISGSIDAVSSTGITEFSGSLMQLMSSASMDDFLDHVGSTRFVGNDVTSIAFQNVTNINSTLYFARLAADEFNYSSNPTYTDADNRIVVIDQGQEEVQRSFTFVTSIGLYDAYDNLLGVGKLSRPVLKDGEKDLNIRLRVDY
jgi:hypothetical protein